MKWYYYQGVKYLRKYYILQIFFNLHIDIEFTPSVKLLLKRKSMIRYRKTIFKEIKKCIYPEKKLKGICLVGF